MRAAGLSSESLIVVEFQMAQRTAVGNVVQIVGYVCFRWLLANAPGPVPDGADILGAVMIVAMLARTGLWLVQKRAYALPGWRARWLVWFRTCFWLGGAAWGALSAVCLANYGMTYPAFVSILINVAITAGASPVQLGADRLLVRGFIPLMIGPDIVVTAMYLDRPGYLVLGILLVLFVVYMFLVAASSRALLVDALHNRHVAQMQREQLVALIDAMPGYVLWTDLEGHVLGMNRRLASEKYEAEAFGQAIREFVASNDRQALTERAVATPDKTHTHILALSRRATAEGDLIILSALDVEAQKEAERQVMAAVTQSQENSRLAALGTLAIGVAHEINNPLQVLRNLGTLLRESQPPGAPQVGLLDKMDRTINRITTIVAALRSFARNGSADLAVLVHVKELVSEVVELVRTTRPKDDAQILIGNIPDQLMLECRETEIGQVLLNLLINALDAVRDLDERWIRIDVADLGDEVDFSVTDSGAGIPTELVDKIMVPFFTTKTGTGTGLGLSISRSIIERHGGTLSVDKASAHTRFAARLPKRGRPGKTSEQHRSV